MAEWEVELHPSAIDEARSARLWYAERSEQAADRFLAELDRAVEQVRNTPGRWPPYLHGTRHFIFRGFPYVLVYRTLATTVQVIAVAHGRRRPGYWKGRLAN